MNKTEVSFGRFLHGDLILPSSDDDKSSGGGVSSSLLPAIVIVSGSGVSLFGGLIPIFDILFSHLNSCTQNMNNVLHTESLTQSAIKFSP